MTSICIAIKVVVKLTLETYQKGSSPSPAPKRCCLFKNIKKIPSTALPSLYVHNNLGLYRELFFCLFILYMLPCISALTRSTGELNYTIL